MSDLPVPPVPAPAPDPTLQAPPFEALAPAGAEFEVTAADIGPAPVDAPATVDPPAPVDSSGLHVGSLVEHRSSDPRDPTKPDNVQHGIVTNVIRDGEKVLHVMVSWFMPGQAQLPPDHLTEL